MKHFVFCILTLFLTINVFSQTKIGTWSEFFNYRSVNDITESNDKIYVSAKIGLFIIDKQDYSIEKLSKINLLSDVDILQIEYNKEKNFLIIVYQNGNIDIIENNQVYNIPDIKNKTTLANKKVNSLIFKDNFVYLSMGFGIVKLDVKQKEIAETYIIGENAAQVAVFQFAYDDKYFYAATETGIYKAEINSSFLIDYRYWTKITDVPNYNGTFKNIVMVGNNLFAIYYDNESKTNSLLKRENNVWSLVTSNLPSYLSLFTNAENIIITSGLNILIFNNFGNQIRKIENYLQGKYFYPLCTVISDGKIMIGTSTEGLLIENKPNTYQQIYPNCPTATFGDIYVKGNKIIALGGGKSIKYDNNWTTGQFSIYDGEKWKTYYEPDGRDYLKLAIDPRDNQHFYIGAWFLGLYEYRDTLKVNLFTQENSVLSAILNIDKYVRISGLKYDNDNNLWALCSSANPLVVLKNDGNWESFDFDNSISDKIITDLFINSLGYKCFGVESQSVMFFDDNQTIENAEDDRYKQVYLIDDDGSAIGTKFYSIAIDNDENIWVGTDDGIAILYDSKNAFDNNYRSTRAKITGIKSDSLFTDYLLKGQVITSIAIDGANRKWFGTLNSGAYLMSDDASVELMHFDISNSPLPSNSIISITVDSLSGTIYFGTEKGLLSYKGDAIKSNPEFTDVYIYPNPVRPDFTGKIVIKGTVEKSNIKITDITGNLVYETTSLGGQAIWDGKNFDGQKVSTGVYLVFCTSEDGYKSVVTKLLFIN